MPKCDIGHDPIEFFETIHCPLCEIQMEFDRYKRLTRPPDKNTAQKIKDLRSHNRALLAKIRAIKIALKTDFGEG